jgi:hypothetical protein
MWASQRRRAEQHAVGFVFNPKEARERRWNSRERIVQTKPLAIYLGTAGILVASVAGAAWSSFGSKSDRPLFMQAAQMPSEPQTANWPPASTTGSVAFLNEWIDLISPLKPRETTVIQDNASGATQNDTTQRAGEAATRPAAATDVAPAPREVVRELPANESAKEKRAKRRAARSEKQRREFRDDDREPETVGLGTGGAQRGERDDEDRHYRSRRDRDRSYRRDREDRDRTVGVRYRDEREPPEARSEPGLPPIGPASGAGLFGLFGSSDGGW